MRYVQRDIRGEIIGTFRWPNELTTEELPDDHPDIVSFRARRAAVEEVSVKRLLALEASLEEQAKAPDARQEIKDWDDARRPARGK